MEDLDSNRMKKYTKRFQFRSRAWCAVIYCFTSLPGVFSSCLGVDVSVSLYPQGDMVIPYGQPLELYCVTENYSSNDTEFIYGGRRIESEIVNSTTRRLFNLEPQKNIYTFYCRNNINGKMCTSRVLVDSPPEDVGDFGCISKNLEVLNCSWTTPSPSFSILKYTLIFSINGRMAAPPCIVNNNYNNRLRHCLWNATSVPRYRPQEKEYVFHLNACNLIGCNSQNFSIDHFSIVKPDPPTDLRVIRRETHGVLLAWRIPNSILDLLDGGVDHIIEYQTARTDNSIMYHRVAEAADLPPRNRTYRFHLKNLPYAHTQYDVRVYIKSKKAVEREFWSDYSHTVFYTASEPPRRPPTTAPGAFDQAVFGNKRIIYVYWKQLESYEEAGANFTYKLLVSDGRKTQTMFPDKDKSLSYVMLDTSLEALDVRVWSFNINGSSLNSSHLHIPSEKDTQSLRITSFTKLAYGNGTYELSWEGIKNVDSYTLFWCQLESYKVCTGRIDFDVIDPEKNNYIIHLPEEHKYQFAISANKGTISSGMIWECDITKFIIRPFMQEEGLDPSWRTHVDQLRSAHC